MNPRLTLHRKHPVEVTLKPGQRRVFAFHIELSLGGAKAGIDADSGMLVNLTQVDRWLRFQCEHLSQNPVTSIYHLVQSSAATLENLITLESPSRDLYIDRLVFHEKRGEFFGCGRSKSRNLAKSRTFPGARDLFCGSYLFLETDQGLQKVTTTFSCDMWKEEDERTHQIPILMQGRRALMPADFAKAFDEGNLQNVFTENPLLLKVQFEHALTGAEKVFQK